ncbi:MAG: DUF1737 domain-containing protein [Verrucomicrobia bacterium]|nr:DUF1737 domain-containing protein [Verrucomicrobiota bacterium]
MEYKLLSVSVLFSFSRAARKLTAAVNEAMAEGWEPLGGPAFLAKFEMVQAMIKRR